MSADASKRKRLKWWQVALIAVGGFFVLMWAIGAIAIAMGYEPETESAPAVETPTSAPAITPTSEPTPEAVKPSPAATAGSTATPTKTAPAVEPKKPEPKKLNRGELLYGDIRSMLEEIGDEAVGLKMYAVTAVDDEGSYLRINYQNTITSKTDAENVVREIYGFTASDAFTDGERNTIVVRGADGRDWNVWVTRDGLVAKFSTSAWE